MPANFFSGVSSAATASSGCTAAGFVSAGAGGASDKAIAFAWLGGAAGAAGAGPPVLAIAPGAGLLVGGVGRLAAAGVTGGDTAMAVEALGAGDWAPAAGLVLGAGGTCARAAEAFTTGAFAVREAGAAITGAPTTKAWAAIELLSSSDPGRSTKETTTTAPAVAPIAVATSAMRAVRMKLGAGAR